jgi:integrase
MSVRKRTWTTRLGEHKEAWIVAYSVFDGATYTRHIKTFDKKKEAEAYHDSVRVEVREGRHTAPSKSPTVREAADLWIKRVEADGCERATVQGYRQHLDLHILPRLGNLKLAHLTAARIEAFRDHLLAEKSRHLAKVVLASTKSMLRSAKYAHVAADVKIATSKRDRKLEVGRDIPSVGEVKRLIEAAAKDTRKRTLLLTVSLTGLRASELRGLRWSDVDLKAEELHVRQRADRYNAIGAPKSASSTRTIPLAPEVLSALKEWKLACPKAEADLVFPTSEGRIQHHSETLAGLHPVMKRAGVVKQGKPKYGLHAFRHFFASWCINPRSRGGRELPVKVVQQLLGHSSVVMTLDRYGHLFPRGDDRAELAAASKALLA